MFYKDTPHFNCELIRWLIAYFLINGNEKIENAYAKVINFAKVDHLHFRDIINEMIINGYIIKDTEPVYNFKPSSKKVLQITNYKHLYSLTKKGKKQLCFGWEFASSCVPKELYDEIAAKIPFIEK